MANEITITTSGNLRNGALIQPMLSQAVQSDQATPRAGSFTVDIGTSEESIDFGDIAPGYVRMTNLDADNFVRVRFAAAANAIRLLADRGQALFYLDAGVTVFAIADTAACRVQVEAYNA